METNQLPLSALCKELSISVATGRNWMKLGKLVPSGFDGSSPFFDSSYVEALRRDLESGKNASLKSRRNKSYISGSSMYSSYVPDSSPNLPKVQKLLNIISEEKMEVTDSLLSALLFECARQLLAQRFDSSCSVQSDASYADHAHAADMVQNDFSKIPKSNLDDHNTYCFLLRAIERNFEIASEVEKLHPELFSIKYTYIEGEDTLGLIYISLKNLGKRKAEGAYYTPTQVVKKLCDNLFSIHAPKGKTILDPCCGTGNFLLQLPEDASYLQVYGGDIDPMSVKLARINYCLKFGVTDRDIVCSHIVERDFLAAEISDRFDFIIGNPPWGSRFTDSEIEFLRQTYTATSVNNIESYDLFTEKALSCLADDGVLSFVLPEAILNVRTHTNIRKVLMSLGCLEYVEFLGDVFDNVQCPSIILQLRRTDAAFDTAGLKVRDRDSEYTIKKSRSVSPAAFDFFMTDEDYSIIEKADNLPGKVTLEGNADFALGIVTGDNKRFISHEKTADNEVIIKGSDLRRYYFVPSDNYVVFRPEIFQQVADARFYRAEEKLFYKFIGGDLVFSYDNGGTLSLNSCNILIPRIPGLDIKYICAVLNSGIARFYYKKRFNSVKILRSHLEQIPIPFANAKTQARIVAMVDAILTEKASDKSLALQDAIDAEILALYGLSE
jgi:predicted RNA methylase